TGGLWRRVDTLLEGDSVVFYKALPQPNWTSADIDTVVHLNENGAQWEASVAGTLWDICDARNDNPNGDACADSLSDGFNTLYNALHTGSPPGTDRVTDVLTARTFYDSLAAHPATNIVKFGLSQRVFCEHGIQGGPTLTAVDGAGSPDARLRIVKVFPNPFNPRIHIVIQVPAQRVRTRTTLRVYDIQGRRVRTLLDGRPPAGVGEVVWDGRSDVGVEAASGVYLCRLESGRSVQAAKVILLR
ncbi:MAG TPA: FlgD immunoglobulin-like domain containing protein, partial [Tepidiformaceae bacterium]|nr:FlgD immunoglobulin-like domain containing protein [Tepidiformaceae bacterium]